MPGWLASECQGPPFAASPALGLEWLIAVPDSVSQALRVDLGSSCAPQHTNISLTHSHSSRHHLNLQKSYSDGVKVMRGCGLSVPSSLALWWMVLECPPHCSGVGPVVDVRLSELVVCEGFPAVNSLAFLYAAMPGPSRFLLRFHRGRCRSLTILMSCSWIHSTVSRIMRDCVFL